MKKILSLLSVLTFSSQCVSGVSACNNDELLKLNAGSLFNAGNISTWGKTQKAIINQAYLTAAAQSHLSTWGGWINDINQTSSMEEKGLTKALHKINPSLDVGIGKDNIKVSYLPAPSNKASLKQVLAQGINLHLQATWMQGEELNIKIKGFIPKPKQTKPRKIYRNYSLEKQALDDPSNASKESPIGIYTPAKSGKILASDWDSYLITNALNETWKVLGGLDEDMYDNVSYEPVEIDRGSTVLCEMYFHNSKENPKIVHFLGYTKKHPRDVYIKGF